MTDPGGDRREARGQDRRERPERRDALRTEDFDYPLPESQIARYPSERRDRSRLLVLRRSADAASGREDRIFSELPSLISPGDALVLNDSRVFPARLRGHKPTGASAEILLLRPVSPRPGERRWRALVRPGGKLKPGREVVVGESLTVHVEDSTDAGGRIVRLEGEGAVEDLIRSHGEVPLPPYIDRDPEPMDAERYQTVYAEHRGSVAAPTAGLHFTPELLGELEDRGVVLVRVTLHVGVGTFRPVEAERPEEHQLEAEWYRVSEDAAAALNRVRSEGGDVWAVGTTAVRTLETTVAEDGTFDASEGWTDLFIHPPHRFRGVDRLLTNFHLPRSSLLMLVCAFAGRERTMAAYRHAVRSGYRFYSYGDAMAIL